MFRCHLTCYKKYKSFVPAKLDTALRNAVRTCSLPQKAQKSRLNFFLEKAFQEAQNAFPLFSFSFLSTWPEFKQQQQTSVWNQPLVFSLPPFFLVFPRGFCRGWRGTYKHRSNPPTPPKKKKATNPGGNTVGWAFLPPSPSHCQNMSSTFFLLPPFFSRESSVSTSKRIREKGKKEKVVREKSPCRKCKARGKSVVLGLFRCCFPVCLIVLEIQGWKCS